MNKDVLFIIAKKLNLSDLVSFCQLNKKINQRTEIWLHKLITEYSNYKDFKFDKTLKEIYITLYQLEKLKNKLNLKYTLIDLYNLEEFDLYYNEIKKIPKEIGRLKTLQSLYLNYNQIKKIPQEIGRLKTLQSLYLNYNQIKEIPKEIGQLHNLQKLYLSNNQIEEIPKEIGKLCNLKEFNISGNRIKKISEKIKLSKNLKIRI